MFVVAMWNDGSGKGKYSIFTLALDTGQVTASQQLVDHGAPGRATFNPDEQDQRTAINLVDGWLWLGFADYQSDDMGRYYGWAVAINAADLTQQLYQPMIIAQVIANLNANKGVVGADSFDGLTQDETGSALEFNPTDNRGHKVSNFAVARVRIADKTPGPTPSPVRVFFRLFQAQSTNSAFNPGTTYKFATDGTPHGRKIPLLGIQNDQHGNPEYVTIPCFATARNNLTGPADMRAQHDPPNAQTITIVPGTEVDHYFGCWLDINQPHQKFLPLSPPAGNVDGPWTSQWANHPCIRSRTRSWPLRINA